MHAPDGLDVSSRKGLDHMKPVPFLSVIVPAHQAEQVLGRALSSLHDSDLPRDSWELIVVDDASTDGTSLIAAEFADIVVCLAGKPHGPAYARNRGVEAASGEVVVFVDSDVCVHTDTLRRFALLFWKDQELAGAFGSYDTNPPDRGLVSSFRNLLHHYVHQHGAGPAETFWAGCGAIRRRHFLEVEGFDEWHFPRPQIEDIELGRRMRRRGHRLLLCPEIQCAHLKRWTLVGMVRTDFKDRGVPWMRMLLAEGKNTSEQSLNLRLRDRCSTALVGVATGALMVAPFAWSVWLPLTALLATLMVVALNRRFYQFLAGLRSPLEVAAMVPLHMLFYFVAGLCVPVGYFMHLLVGAPVPSAAVKVRSMPESQVWPPRATHLPSSIFSISPSDPSRGS